MLYRFLADGIVVFHLCFVVFVLFGSLLVLRWPRMAWVHVPAAVWGVVVEFTGWLCPLTPLENRMRERAGVATYEGGFVEHYIVPVLYPSGAWISSDNFATFQIVFGSIVLV